MKECTNSDLYEEIRNEVYAEEHHKLEICIPIVKPYHNIAFPMSIIGCKSEYKSWAYSNFMNIYSLYQNDELTINYDVQYYENQVYYLEMEKITLSLFDLFEKEPIGQIKKIIDKKKYICLFIDEFYLDGTWCYMREHYNHEIMIYGYDENKRRLYCAYYGEDWHYSLREVKYESFINSFYSNYLNRDLPFIIYSHHNKWFRPYYAIDPQFIKYTLKRYVTGENFLYDRRHINPLYGNQMNKYGINIYDDAKRYYINRQKSNKYVDLRPFYIIYENKIVMMKRIYFLYEEHILKNKDYITEYRNIVTISRRVLNLVIKYNVDIKKNTQELNKRIISDIEKIEKIEKDFLIKIIQII